MSRTLIGQNPSLIENPNKESLFAEFAKEELGQPSKYQQQTKGRTAIRPLTAKPQTTRNLGNKLQMRKDFETPNRPEIIDERDEYYPLQKNIIVDLKHGVGVGTESNFRPMSSGGLGLGSSGNIGGFPVEERLKEKYGIKSSYDCKNDYLKKPQVRPYSAVILAIQQDKKPSEIDQEQVQSATQTQQWKDLITQTLDLECNKKAKRVQSSKTLLSKPESSSKILGNLLPDEFLKQMFFKNSTSNLLGSQCPHIVSTVKSLQGTTKPTVEQTSILWKPQTNASNYKKVLKNSQPTSDVKYRSTGFEHFQNLDMPAKKKIEYYKLHKSIYDYKMEKQKKDREEQEFLENRMPIYSKDDLIQIKNGNLNVVLQFNATVRPNSASSRVLMRETDPMNNLKRRFYRNSNKPLGNNDSKKNDYFSKRQSSTISELHETLKQKGILDKELERQLHENFSDDIQEENSMLRSDIDEGELQQPLKATSNEIIEEDEKEYELVKNGASFMDTQIMNAAASVHSILAGADKVMSFAARPFSAIVQNKPIRIRSDYQVAADGGMAMAEQQQELDSQTSNSKIINVKTGGHHKAGVGHRGRPKTSKMTNFQKIMRKNQVHQLNYNRHSQMQSSSSQFQTQISTADEQSQAIALQQVNTFYGRLNQKIQLQGSQMSVASQGTESDNNNPLGKYSMYTASRPQSPIYQHLVPATQAHQQDLATDMHQQPDEATNQMPKNRQLRINTNFNYQYHRNKRLQEAYSSTLNSGSSKNLQSLRPSASAANILQPPVSYQTQPVINDLMPMGSTQSLGADEASACEKTGGGYEDEFHKQLAKAQDMRTVLTLKKANNNNSRVTSRPSTAKFSLGRQSSMQHLESLHHQQMLIKDDHSHPLDSTDQQELTQLDQYPKTNVLLLQKNATMFNSLGVKHEQNKDIKTQLVETQNQQIQQSGIELIDEPKYLLKGSARNRPISAALNNKINKGYYKTIELKFGKGGQQQQHASTQPGNKVKDSDKKKVLLQYMGHDYQGLMRPSPYAQPSGLEIQRQVNTKMPISHNLQADMIEMIEEAFHRGGCGPEFQNQQHPQQFLDMGPNSSMGSEPPMMMMSGNGFDNTYLQFKKPSVATLNCYMKPNSSTKMLMIGPTHQL